jgi:hypothetical protein
MGRNPAGRQARPGQPLHSNPPLSVSAQPMKRPTRPNLPEPSSVPQLAQWPLPLPEHGAAWPWPPLPVLAAPPCTVRRRPAGANRVRHSSWTARGALPVPVPTRPHSVLGEDFRAKEQNRGVIKEIKTNPQRNWNESRIRDEVPHPHDPFPL